MTYVVQYSNLSKTFENGFYLILAVGTVTNSHIVRFAYTELM